MRAKYLRETYSLTGGGYIQPQLMSRLSLEWRSGLTFDCS
jgi:hypothetical protein